MLVFLTLCFLIIYINKMKQYKAKTKGFINYVMILFFLLPFVVFYLKTDEIMNNILLILPLVLPFLILFWMYSSTKYSIENTLLKYQSGFIKGVIEIKEIREITVGKTMWSGLKPALASKGIIIKYGKFDEIYIAPENNLEMVEDMLKIKPEIVIKD